MIMGRLQVHVLANSGLLKLKCKLYLWNWEDCLKADMEKHKQIKNVNKVNAHGEILLHRITMMPDCSS